jgi:hypothetical protein
MIVRPNSTLDFRLRQLQAIQTSNPPTSSAWIAASKEIHLLTGGKDAWGRKA